MDFLRGGTIESVLMFHSWGKVQGNSFFGPPLPLCVEFEVTITRPLLVSRVFGVRSFSRFAQDKLFMRGKKQLSQLVHQFLVALEPNFDNSVISFL